MSEFRGVLNAASFGFNQLYNPQAASYQITSATQQVPCSSFDLFDI